MDSDTHKTDAAPPRVERTTVTPEDAERLGKPPGEYRTIFTGDLSILPSVCAAGTCLAETIEPFLTPYFGKKLCLCGLGNPTIIGNALGADTIKSIPAHLLDYSTAQQDRKFTQVFTLTPDIPYATNLSTEIFLSTFLSAAQADFAILVHPTVTQDITAFCRTIQISTASQTRSHTGDTNDWSVIGAPVLSVGVPLVFDLVGLLTEGSLLDESARHFQTSHNWLTTFQIQDVTAVASAVLAFGLIRVCYPHLSEALVMEAVQFYKTTPIRWGLSDHECAFVPSIPSGNLQTAVSSTADPNPPGSGWAEAPD